jgi:hypothetical protein
VIQPDNPWYINLANIWILLNSGAGPTPDKPEVLLETPSDLRRVNSFLNASASLVCPTLSLKARWGRFASRVNRLSVLTSEIRHATSTAENRLYATLLS